MLNICAFPVQQISMFVDIGLDDSYTPQKISIRAGTSHADLQEVRAKPFRLMGAKKKDATD